MIVFSGKKTALAILGGKMVKAEGTCSVGWDPTRFAGLALTLKF